MYIFLHMINSGGKRVINYCHQKRNERGGGGRTEGQVDKGVAIQKKRRDLEAQGRIYAKARVKFSFLLWVKAHSCIFEKKSFP